MLKSKFTKALYAVVATTFLATCAMSSIANAEVDSRVLKDKNNNHFEYKMVDLNKSFKASLVYGINSPQSKLFADYVDRVSTGTSLYSFHDTINGYVSFNSAYKAFIVNMDNFNLDSFTESNKAEKIVLKDIPVVSVENGEIVVDDPADLAESFEVLAID